MLIRHNSLNIVHVAVCESVSVHGSCVRTEENQHSGFALVSYL